MSLYAESSAVLAWLLDEAAGAFVRQTLAQTEIVLASDLTLVECDRVLHRAAALGGVGASSKVCRKRRQGDAATSLPGLNFQLSQDLTLRDAIWDFAQAELAPRAVALLGSRLWGSGLALNREIRDLSPFF